MVRWLILIDLLAIGVEIPTAFGPGIINRVGCLHLRRTEHTCITSSLKTENSALQGEFRS